MKRVFIWLLLGFIFTTCSDCRAKAEKIELSSDPNFNSLTSRVEKLRKKAETGDALAQCKLGGQYYYGWVVKQDYKEAAIWYRKAAEQGIALAQCQLGRIYREGQGVKQDYKEAVKWFRKAADQGDTRAQCILGLMHKEGQGVEQDYKEAANWYRKAAERGVAGAQFSLGLMYCQGQGIQQDYNEAFKWFHKAAEQGDAEAQFSLGLMYEDGQGVKQDYEEAVKWFRKAAEQGNTRANCFLGLMYLDGQGIKQDYKEAFKFFRKAAEQGFALAQFTLGSMYEDGVGVIEDYVEAYKWYLLAGMNGQDVSELKKSIQRKMTAAQIAEAQRRAKAFVARKETKADQGEESSIIKSTGTGFFINSQGYLLTSRHVIEGAKTVKVLTDKGIFPATVIHADSFNDIAILKVGGQGFGALSIISSRDVKTGDKVFTIGFPNVGLQGFEPKYTEGVISSLSGAKDDPRYFQISTPVQPGNSGGPLINERCEVVGIITARLSEASSLATTGTLPQNVNYALKSSYVRAFLEVVPKVANKPLEDTEQDLSNRAVQIEKARKAVVLVLNYY